MLKIVEQLLDATKGGKRKERRPLEAMPSKVATT